MFELICLEICLLAILVDLYTNWVRGLTSSHDTIVLDFWKTSNL